MNNETIINTWRSTPVKLVPLTASAYCREPVKVNGEYAIYKAGEKHFVYTYKNFAFMELCALNLEHFNTVVNNTTLTVKDQMYWLNERSKNTIQRINQLLKYTV